MRNYLGVAEKEKKFFYRDWTSSCAFNFNIQFLILIKLYSQGQYDIEFAFFIRTFWLVLKSGRGFFVEMEYARHRGWRGVEDISLCTKFNCWWFIPDWEYNLTLMSLLKREKICSDVELMGHLAWVTALLPGTKCPEGIAPAWAWGLKCVTSGLKTTSLYSVLFSLEWVFWWRRGFQEKGIQLACFTSVLRGGEMLVTLQRMESYI